MSGIAALYERDGVSAEEARIVAMLDRLRHRGPDRSGHRIDGSVALGQCMLETTPEDAFERQPYKSPSGDVWIIADARIDNRDELLRLGGEPERDVPDAALILRAYERWGEACPARLLGDFAFVIWDGVRRRLFCARDHLGVRPLYYHHDAVSFRCASEMHAIFADRRVPRRPDRSRVALFLIRAYAEEDATLYDGVFALPAGHSLTVAPGGAVEVRAYWQPDLSRSIRYASDDAYADHFRAVFSEAVRCRLRANRPLAAEVSGGLDSSSVACEAERLRRAGLAAGPPLTLMRVAFPGLECDETPYSQAVADLLGLPIFTAYPLDDLTLCQPAPTPPDHYFEPVGRTLLPLLDETDRRGIRTTLSGLGGDQLMCWTGYESLHHLLHGRLRDAAVEAGLDEAPFAVGPWRTLVTQGLREIVPLRVWHVLRRLRRGPQERWPWLTPAVAEEVLGHVSRAELRAAELHADPINRALCDGLAHDLSTPYALALSDRTAALRGQECRYPFLDVRVIEYLLAIPNEQRFYRGLPKPVLRRAMAGTLPEVVARRRDKADFTCCLRLGLLDPHADAIRALFQPSRLEGDGIVSSDALRAGLAADWAGLSLPTVSSLISMELWLRQADC